MKELKAVILDYLNQAKLLQIGTTKNNKPWVATVWFSHDKDFNFYFISHGERRHSSELGDNPNVAGTIVAPHTLGSGEKVVGLQFEGIAEKIEDEEKLEKALDIYYSRYPNADRIPHEQFHNGVACYVIHPKTLVLFDQVDYFDNPRHELKL